MSRSGSSFVAALAVAWIASTSPAAPCSQPCRVVVIPASGSVPANLGGVWFWSTGPLIEPDAGPPITITEIIAGAEEALPITVTYDEHIGMRLARFGRGLVPGARYRVDVASRCVADVEAATSYFDAGAEAPLPVTLGTLHVGPQVTDERDVWTYRGSCTSRAGIRARTLTLAIAADAQPWIDALHMAWWAHGYLTPGIEPIDAARVDAYRVCESDDTHVEPGFVEGTTTVSVVGTLPGSDHDIAPATGEVAFDCAAPAPTAAPDDVGCSGGLGVVGPLALVIVVCVRGSARRRSARET